MANPNEPFHWTSVLADDLASEKPIEGMEKPDHYNLAPIILAAQGLKAGLDTYMRKAHSNLSEHRTFKRLQRAVDSVAAYVEHPKFILERWNGGAGDTDWFETGVRGNTGFTSKGPEKDAAIQREYRTLLYKHGLECAAAIRELDGALHDSFLTAGTTHEFNGPIEMMNRSFDLGDWKNRQHAVSLGISTLAVNNAVSRAALNPSLDAAFGRSVTAR